MPRFALLSKAIHPSQRFRSFRRLLQVCFRALTSGRCNSVNFRARSVLTSERFRTAALAKPKPASHVTKSSMARGVFHDQSRANAHLQGTAQGCTVTARHQTARVEVRRVASFAETLKQVLSMARKAEASGEFQAEFREQLQALPASARARLGVLLTMGREAHGVALRMALSKSAGSSNTRAASKHTAGSSKGSVPLDVFALCEAKTLSQRYLERGLAAACAGKLTLGASGSDELRPDQRLSVAERAWSRFGRELASSEPSEWSWFACYKGRSPVLDKLYVRRGNGAWWSFAASIDRPLSEQIDVDRRRATGTRQQRQGSSLESLLTQEPPPSRRALHRALTSVHARLGKVRAGTKNPVP